MTFRDIIGNMIELGWPLTVNEDDISFDLGDGRTLSLSVSPVSGWTGRRDPELQNLPVMTRIFKSYTVEVGLFRGKKCLGIWGYALPQDVVDVASNKSPYIGHTLEGLQPYGHAIEEGLEVANVG